MLLLKKLLLLSILALVLAVSSVFAMYFYFKDDLPSVDVLQDVQLQTPMRIYTQDERLISQYGVKRRIPVTLDEVPDTLVQAVIATEDSRFYDHIGVDPIGVTRAVLNLILTGEKQQGASTLTMQLARGFFGLTRKKEYSRKIKEIFIALRMERELTKDQILELYLNKVELGHRAFGFGAAAQVYYGKSLKELSLAQIATIAGLPQAPSVLNPISRPDRSVERRRIVLLRMLDEGFITRQQFDEAANEPVTAKKHGAEIELYAPYLADLAYSEMIEIYGKEIAETSGFRVFTTVQSKKQKAAQNAVVRNLHDYDERHGYRGALGRLWHPIDAQIVEEQEWELPLNEEQLASLTVLMQKKLNQININLIRPSDEEILEHLKSIEQIGDLQPAVVTQVSEQTALVLTTDGNSIELPWDGLDWARPYISDQAQGPDPETAADVVQEGEVVYVRQRLSDGVWQISQFPSATSAFVALNPFNGAVEALVGGYSFEHSQFNRATQAKRQVGSNIKPFIYASALNNGYTLASIINDAPINQWDASSGVAWRPQNSPAVYDGPIRMRVALGKSKNVVSVRLLRGVGLSNTRDYLTQFGFQRDEVPLDETMSLGSGAHTPMEVASAMAVIANGGFAVRPHFIERIENSLGEVIWRAEPLYACDPCDHVDKNGSAVKIDNLDDKQTPPDNGDQEVDIESLLAAEFATESAKLEKQSEEITLLNSAPRVIDEEIAFLISDMLRTAVRGNGRSSNNTYWVGTGWRARNLLQRDDIGGKTGTTNDSRDTWFTGYAANLVASAWVGFDDNNRKLGRVSRNQNLVNKNPTRFNWIGNAMIGAEDGAKAAQPAWIRFMKEVLEGVPEVSKSIPDGIVRVRIDRETGLLTRRTDGSSMFEYFKKGTEPTAYVADDSLTLPIEEDNDSDEALEQLF